MNLPNCIIDYYTKAKSEIKDNSLYHYTNFDGLKGIFENGKLRLTEISYMNDRNEFLDIFNIFRVIYHSDNKYHNENKEIFDHVNKAIEKIDQIPFRYKPDNIFVFCFSTAFDDLNQWRSYAKRGGYLIGFNFDYLEELRNANRADFLPCIYEEDVKVAYLKTIIDYIIENRDLHLKNGLYSEERIIENAKYWILHDLITYSPIFKNHHFTDEREWRLFFIKDIFVEEGYFNRGNLIVPCANINVVSKKANVFPFTSLEIGPLPEQDQMLAKNSLKSYIEMHSNIFLGQIADENVYKIWRNNIQNLLDNNIFTSDIPYKDD